MAAKSRDDDAPFWFAWLFEYAPILIIIGMLGGGVIVAAFGWHVERRLSSIEQDLDVQLRYRAPGVETNHASFHTPSTSGDVRRTYVPAHSHIYVRDGDPLLLTITLSVRNTDAQSPLSLLSAGYYDTTGKRVKEFVPQPLRIAPLATAEFLVGESDRSGGSGASFLVDWSAPDGADEPVIEALMIGAAGSQGISFVQRGNNVTSSASKSTPTE